jgi:uncharacterized protein YbjT (DUF2867 family)
MRVTVVGGGISGAAIARAVEERGGEARLLSRSTGFDVLRDDARAAIAGADAVVEATGLFTMSARRATRFFTGSTRAVGGAALESGARHVLLSIVGCTLPEVQGYGYFAGKTAQEETARTTGAELTIVRSTQWFEFARQNLARMRFGPIARWCPACGSSRWRSMRSRRSSPTSRWASVPDRSSRSPDRTSRRSGR